MYLNFNSLLISDYIFIHATDFVTIIKGYNYG